MAGGGGIVLGRRNLGVCRTPAREQRRRVLVGGRRRQRLLPIVPQSRDLFARAPLRLGRVAYQRLELGAQGLEPLDCLLLHGCLPGTCTGRAACRLEPYRERRIISAGDRRQGLPFGPYVTEGLFDPTAVENVDARHQRRACFECRRPGLCESL